MRKNGRIFIFFCSRKVILKGAVSLSRRKLIAGFFQAKLMAIVFLVETLLLVNKSNKGIECDNV